MRSSSVKRGIHFISVFSTSGLYVNSYKAPVGSPVARSFSIWIDGVGGMEFLSMPALSKASVLATETRGRVLRQCPHMARIYTG